MENDILSIILNICSHYQLFENAHTRDYNFKLNILMNCFSLNSDALISKYNLVKKYVTM